MIGLLYASLGSIIGSGWLFGALHAAVQAGPWSVLSWVIGAVAILFLAFVFAELSTMFPNSGALVHMTHVSHGDLVGKIWSWILFLAFVSVPPVEVSAVLTYANNYIPGLIGPHTGLMTGIGMVLRVRCQWRRSGRTRLPSRTGWPRSTRRRTMQRAPRITERLSDLAPIWG